VSVEDTVVALSRTKRWTGAEDRRRGDREKLRMVRRDLHDKVGSSLAGMAMVMETAERMINADPAEARQLVGHVRADLSELIAVVRRLSADREVPDNVCALPTAMRAMVGRMCRLLGDRKEIFLTIDERAETVPEDVGWAAFWIMREALTNVLKHSGGRHCSVSVLVRDGHLLIRVVDDGVPTDTLSRSDGSGLTNMADRAAEQGGWCVARPMHPIGFAVVAAFPLVAQAA
jgi:signal transduction histidine kinase